MLSKLIHSIEYFSLKHKNALVISGLILVLLVYSSISLVNHYMFRTSAFDLGIFNHAMYDYAHLRFNEASVMLGFVEINNLLADHFSILQIFFSPLYYLFGTYTLLIIQIAFVMYGSYGIKRYISLFTQDPLIPILAQLHFFVSFGVIAALGFDYHDSVVAASFVPHLLYYADLKEWKSVIILSALILLCRVELAIWLIFISFALFFSNRKSFYGRLTFAGIALFAFVYFVLVIKLIIPQISKDGYTQFNFSILGDDVGEAFVFAVTHPFETISYLFRDQHNGPIQNFLVKRDFYIAFLVSGGFLMIFRPIFMLMLFPVIAQRMLNDSTLKWGIGGHYSIEAVTILSIAVFHVISTFKNKYLRRLMALLLIVSSALCTKYFWDHRYPDWYDTSTENFLSARHYQREFDVVKLHKALKIIPDDAVVSAMNNLVPHLTSRRKIYLFPYTDDADYLVLNEKSNNYPMIWEDFVAKIEILKSDPSWELIYDENYTYIYKRKELN